MALQLRALAVLTEDLNWVPSTQVRQFAVICNSSFDIWGFTGTLIHIATCRHPPTFYIHMVKTTLNNSKRGKQPETYDA